MRQPSRPRRRAAPVASALLPLLLLGAPGAGAGPPGTDDATWYLQGGAYAHYSDDEDYEGPPLFAGVEYQRPDDVLYGFSVFNNSYGQFSQYVYLGKTWRPWQDALPGLRFKLSAGIVQGYHGEHYDVLPIRWGGSWGLGAVPAIGWQRGDIGFDVAVLSLSGLLFLVGKEF
jgi:hypothetical protein